MTYKEASEILAAIPPSDKPSKVNPFFTISRLTQIVKEAVWEGLEGGKADKYVDFWLEKRVLQVSRNQRRPKMV